MTFSFMKIFVYFSISLLCWACGTTKSSNSNKKYIENFELQKGVFDLSFRVGKAVDWNMKMSIPAIESGKKYPLILALHWAGNLTAYQAYADCLAFPALDTLGGIILAPSSGGLHWTQPINEKRILELITEIKKHWPVDEKKIIVTGYSNGGIGTWFLADKYPDLFSAAIPIAGYYRPTKLKIPTYVIHGETDELFAVKEVENAVQMTQKKSPSVELEIIENFSHYMGCKYVEVLQKKALKIQEDLF